MRLIGQLCSARHRARVVPEQCAEKVLLLLDPPLEVGKLEVSCCHVTDQSASNRFAGPFSRQQICPGGFSRSAVLSPKIELPGQREINLICAALECGELLCAYGTLVRGLASGTDRRQLIGPGD